MTDVGHPSRFIRVCYGEPAKAANHPTSLTVGNTLITLNESYSFHVEGLWEKVHQVNRLERNTQIVTVTVDHERASPDRRRYRRCRARRYFPVGRKSPYPVQRGVGRAESVRASPAPRRGSGCAESRACWNGQRGVPFPQGYASDRQRKIQPILPRLRFQNRAPAQTGRRRNKDPMLSGPIAFHRRCSPPPAAATRAAESDSPGRIRRGLPGRDVRRRCR